MPVRSVSVQVRPPSLGARQPDREVGDHAVGRGARRLAKRRQPVLRDLVELPVLRRRIDLRIGRTGVRRRERHERPTAVTGGESRRRQREERREDGEHAAAER